MFHRTIHILLLLCFATPFSFTFSDKQSNPDTVKIDLDSWPEADSLFRRDKQWLGGDDAYSVDLGNSRVLWLFADSFIATGSGQTRREAKLVRNSVAIQQGYDPSSADIKFYWKVQGGTPASFFRETMGVWYWPGHGIRIDDSLLIFLMKVRQANTDLGFQVFGWEAVIISNFGDEPSTWRMRWLYSPPNDFGVIVGSASVLRMGEFVYAFGAEEPGVHDVYLVRWRKSKAARGDLREPEWWTGGAQGWLAQSTIKQKPAALFSGGQTEFTVHYQTSLNRFLQIQTKGFGKADIAVRWAKTLTGPWSELQSVYTPSEGSRADALIYAGKSHPALVGADLVLTYVVNSTDFNRLLNDPSIYYPRFLRGSFKPNQQVNAAAEARRDRGFAQDVCLRGEEQTLATAKRVN